jgi:endonuclease YncB( thermonuclease family)
MYRLSQKANAKSWPARWQFRAGARTVEAGTRVRSLFGNSQHAAAHLLPHMRLTGWDEPRSRLLPALALGLSIGTAWTAGEAAEISGKVTRVYSGDLLQVRDNDASIHVVRLAGVDAPDRHQAYSTEAARQLSRLVRGQAVRILWRKRDRSGAKVGIVLRGRRDLNLAMIESGYAWHFGQLNDELGATDRSRYASAQDAAARQHRGLWRQHSPVPPWALRKSPFR